MKNIKKRRHLPAAVNWPLIVSSPSPSADCDGDVDENTKTAFDAHQMENAMRVMKLLCDRRNMAGRLSKSLNNKKLKY